MQIHRDGRVPTLRAQLEQLEGEPTIVTEHLSAMLALCQREDSVFSSWFFEPGHFTASAFVLSPDRQSLLLILHRKLGLWLQPGGHVEVTDAGHVEAAIREVHEETGVTDFELLSSLFDVDVHTIPEYKGKPPHLHHDLRILLVARSDRVQAADDAVSARWFPLSDVLREPGDLAEGASTDESVRRVTRRLMDLRRTHNVSEGSSSGSSSSERGP